MINKLFKNNREIAYSSIMPRGRDNRAGEHDKSKKNHAWWLDCVAPKGKHNARVLTNKEREQNTQINERWERIMS